MGWLIIGIGIFLLAIWCFFRINYVPSNQRITLDDCEEINHLYGMKTIIEHGKVTGFVYDEGCTLEEIEE